MKARSGAHPAVRQLRQRGFNAEEGGEAPRLLFWDGEVHLKNHYTKEDRSYCLSRHPCHPTPPEMTAKEWVSTINTNTMTRDPIGGMTVNPDSALHAERDGETQYFCSEDCREQFMAAPVGGPRAGPCVVVIFGASGDLTKRKLLPALCNLVASGLMAENFAIIGVGRKAWSDEDFRKEMGKTIAEFAAQQAEPDMWKNLEQRMSYCSGAYTDPATPGPNLLIMHLQPEEGITLQMRAKMPGPTIRTRAVTLDFDYSQFGKTAPATGYEKLLYDCMMGDTTLFHRADMVEAAWKMAEPILTTWANEPGTALPDYSPGTWGPPEAGNLHPWQSR